MAKQVRIADDLLAKLAGDIETSELMEALGRELGCTTAAINRYTETNNKGGRVTCKGTRDMLLDWRQGVESSNQRPILKEALTKAGMSELAETLFKATPNISEQDPGQTPPATTDQGASPDSPRSNKRKLTNKEIVDVSTRLSADKYRPLCNTLGLDYNYTQTKLLKKGANAALKELLQEWTTEGGFKADLDEALFTVGYIDKY